MCMSYVCVKLLNIFLVFNLRYEYINFKKKSFIYKLKVHHSEILL